MEPETSRGDPPYIKAKFYLPGIYIFNPGGVILINLTHPTLHITFTYLAGLVIELGISIYKTNLRGVENESVVAIVASVAGLSALSITGIGGASAFVIVIDIVRR